MGAWLSFEGQTRLDIYVLKLIEMTLREKKGSQWR